MKQNIFFRRFFIFFIFLCPLSSTLCAVCLADSSVSSKEQARAFFQKGKTLYDQGKYIEAFAEWDAAKPVLEGQSVQKTIQFLKTRVNPALLNNSPAVAIQKDGAPEPAPVSSAPVSRAAPVTSVVAPSLPAPAAEPTKIAAPVAPLASKPEKTALAVTLKTLKITSVESPTSSKISAKVSLESVEEASQKMEAEQERLAEEVTQRREVQASAGKARKEATRLIAKGKKAFQKGRAEEAAREWEKLLPYVDDPASLKVKIQTFEQNHRRLEEFKKQAALKKTEPSKLLPAKDSEEVVTEANRKLEGRIQELQKSIKKLEADTQAELIRQAKEAAEAQKKNAAAQAEKEQQMQEAFEAGKALFEKEDYDGAAKAWEKILPETADSNRIRKTLGELTESQKRVLRMKELAQKSPASPSAPLEALSQEKQLLELLQEAAFRLGNQSQELDARVKNASQGEKAAKERQALIEDSFQKGKKLYGQERYDEAAEVWASLAPYLKNRSLIEDMIRDIHAREREIQALKKVSSRNAPIPSAVPHEKELKAMLETASARVSAATPGLSPGHKTIVVEDTPQAKNTKLGKGAVEEQVLEGRNPAWVRLTFEQGKTLYEMKRTREAFQLWGTLQAYLSKEPQMKAYIEKASAQKKMADVR